MMLRFFISLCLVSFYSVTLFGCSPGQKILRSSNSAPLTEIIEPVKDSRQTGQKMSLNLPASLAIVAVPSKQFYDNQVTNPSQPPGNQPSTFKQSSGIQVPNTTLRQSAEKLKQQLLVNPKYIRSVTVVTADDIKEKISLEKIRALYASDIAIILSYQQDQRSNQSGPAGLMDVTIVGVFLFPGVEIKTSSIIDGKVIHIPSNAIIFRASGTDERSSHSTSFAVDGNATEESINSILAATTDFGNILTKALSSFDNYDLSKGVPASFQEVDDSVDAAKGKPASN